jgi:asparagine synthase (glutamine-hydrolysing)
VCGIAGAFFVADDPAVEAFARTAGGLLAHRGPDDEGRYDAPEGTLVHRRLSILDPTPAGHQPFESADGRYRIIHNGEIYNYLELREELRERGYAFRTDTDTEVMLAALDAWDVEGIERFNGIWAFAVWDSVARRLILSRDRLGVKPLFLVRRGRGLAFASELKALAPLAGSVDPNLSAVRDYLWRGLTDHADATFDRRIESLPPATTLVLDASGERRVRYWRISELSTDADPRPSADDRRAIDDFAALLRDAVALQLRSDVPVGTCLSGGLDSSTIVALASRIVGERTGAHESAPRIALTASFPGSADDETERAALVARHAGIDHVAVEPRQDGIVGFLDTLICEQDEPFLSSSILAQRAVMQAAGERGIKVMLDGQGADELLAGYLHYRYAWLLGIARHHPWHVPSALRAGRRLGLGPAVALRQAFLARLQLRPSGFAPIGRAAATPAWLGPAVRTVDPLPLRDAAEREPSGTPLARHLRRAVLSTSLPALLRFEDRNSMRFGVEARVPFLDHRIVEAACRLPDRLKIADGVTKVALREAGRGLLPDAILRDNRKIGFATPQVAWLHRDAAPIAAALRDSTAVRVGLLARVGVERVLAAPPEHDGGAAIWRCLSIELWARRAGL